MPESPPLHGFLRANAAALTTEWQRAVRQLPRRRESDEPLPAGGLAEVLARVIELVESRERSPAVEPGAASIDQTATDEFALLRRLVLARVERAGVTASWQTMRLLDEAIDTVALARAERLRDLAARARGAERRTQTAAQRQQFLADASRALAESLDYRATLQTVARLAVPAIVDWCVVDLRHEDGSLARVAVEHRDPARHALANDFQERFPPRADAAVGPANVIRTGRTEFEPHVSESALRKMAPEPERARLLAELGFNSYLSVPLQTRGRILGSITFFTEGGRSLAPEDVAMAEDLARRAATAIDNASLYDDAQRALHARENILAVVTHDLRTPLSAIVTASANQIAAAPATEEGARIRKRAETVQRAARHMTRLITDLTDLAHIDTGRLAIEAKPHDPAALARDVVEAMQPAASERGTVLRLDVAGTIPPIDCDGDRIVQVLSNLTANAIKVGSPTVTVRVEARPGDVLFTVSDTGPGISADEVPHMFDRYWRGPRSQYRGSGLGLPIARGIVVAHGGKIWITSEVGGGSRFYFTLPRASPLPD